MKPPNQAGGTLARMVPILKPGDKKKQSSFVYDDEVTSPETSLPVSNSTSTLANNEKEEKKEEEKLDKDAPPPIPPKLTHTTSVGGLDVHVASGSPLIPLRANSPKLDTLPESYLTFRPPKQPKQPHRLPPEIPNNELSQPLPPPRPPRVNHSPVTPPTPNNDLPPPLPVRRSFSPSFSSPSISNNSNTDSPPPRPPRPPSHVKSSSPTDEKNDSKNVFEYEKDSNKPPVLPPRASPSYHSKTSESAPPIPPKSNR